MQTLISTDPTDSLLHETQLSRLGKSPSNIEFLMDIYEKLSSEERHIVQLICQHAKHWDTLSLVGPEDICKQLQYPIRGQLTHLRKLTIEMGYDTDRESLSLDVFLDTPALQTISANQMSWSFPIPMILPWLQLLQYGGSSTWCKHLRALHSASNLVHCALEIRGVPLPAQTRAVLPHLLEVGHVGWSPRTFKQPHQPDVHSRGSPHPNKSDAAVFSLPAELVRDFGSRPQMAPALEYISGILIAEDPIMLKDCVHSFIQAIESHRRWLKCGEILVLSYKELGLPPDILEQKQLLSTNEMEFDLLVDWEILWDANVCSTNGFRIILSPSMVESMRSTPKVTDIFYLTADELEP
ncbi:hypothetical protein K438DRAFT_1748124 [Mycena galopus ATCC 62051]|nr:hypothetical protein K438DRAFT_1748124 [Mycena galopus ATCC 62051]